MKAISTALSLVLLLSLVALQSCKKEDSPTNAESFTDNLTLGTGLNSSNLFQLVGEGTSFKGPTVTIFWRLESKDDMAGSAVNIKIETLLNGVSSAAQTYPFSNPSSSGHIMLSSFTLTQTGSFRATGILAATNKTVASRDFTVQP